TRAIWNRPLQFLSIFVARVPECPRRSPVPLIAQRGDLVGETGKILVGAAAVVFDNNKQPLAHVEQPFKGRTGALGLVADRRLVGARGDALGVAARKAGHTAARKLITAAGERRFGRIPFKAEFFCKTGCNLVVTVVDKDISRFGREMVNPAAQSVVVGMAGHARQLGNLGVDRDGFAKALDLLGPCQLVATKLIYRRVGDKEDGTWLPQ